MSKLGKILELEIFGVSHGEYIGATLTGLPEGIEVDTEFVKEMLSRRRPQGNFETQRVENDIFEFVSGVKDGLTNGEPLTIHIMNENTHSSDYSNLKDVPRPSHADYPVYIKEKGENDYRGGGHTSARLTAPIVALGAVVIKALIKKGIIIKSHIKQVGNIYDETLLTSDKEILDNKYHTILDLDERIDKLLEEVVNNQKTIGGSIETEILNVPVGLGEPWFESFDGVMTNAMFSIPAVKAVEFGLGKNFNNGIQSNDEYFVKDGKIVISPNNNGGVLGGYTTGAPVVFTTTFKPISSISTEQNSVNLKTMEEVKLTIKGRHDPFILRRALPIVDSMASFVVLDFYMREFGRDSIK